MKGAVTLALLTILSSACSRSENATPPRNVSGSTLATIEIPRATDISFTLKTTMSGQWHEDLDGLLKRQYLRLLVAPSRTHAQRTQGKPEGRTIDAAAALQSFVRDKYKTTFMVVVVETPENELISDLLSGHGDVAANLLLTFERDDQVAFAKPVRTGIRELVVIGPSQRPLVSLEDVGGRTIHVRQTSDHYVSLLRLNTQLKGINRPEARVVAAPSSSTDEDLLEAVNNGRIPATIVDDYVFDKWHAAFPSASTNRDVAVSQDGILAWVTRKDQPKLLALINEFFSTHTLSF